MKNSIMASKLLRRGLLVLLFVACVTILLSLTGSRQVSSQTSNPSPPPQARNEAKPVSLLIDNAKRAGRNFPLAEPFNPQPKPGRVASYALPGFPPVNNIKNNYACFYVLLLHLYLHFKMGTIRFVTKYPLVCR